MGMQRVDAAAYGAPWVLAALDFTQRKEAMTQGALYAAAPLNTQLETAVDRLSNGYADQYRER